MALRGFGAQLWQTKLKDVPGFVSSKLTPANVSDQAAVALADYRRTFIDTGSAKPVQHLIVATFAIAYAVAWPTEYKHWKHEQDVKNGVAAAH